MVAANEEVHGRDVRRMITQEGAPSLRDSDLTLRARVIALFKLTWSKSRTDKQSSISYQVAEFQWIAEDRSDRWPEKRYVTAMRWSAHTGCKRPATKMTYRRRASFC